MQGHKIAAALGLLILTVAAPAAAAPTPSATHSVPPAAPTPTSHGKSPEAPDPHPPRGGIGPYGEPVGGPRLLSRGLVLPPHPPKLPKDITAHAWIVVDLDSGAVVAARDPHGRYQPASIQKLLTTITLLPLLPGDRTVTVSRSAADTEGSHAGLVAGGRYTVDELFEGLLLVSGNDAAEALAQAAGGRARTVALMNAEALRLGAYDTYVQTPSGLDGWQQLTSAYDMAIFLRAALAQPRFVRYDTLTHAILPRQKHTGAVGLWNQNELFLTTVKGALAAKTGYTDAAQHTFAGAIARHGHRSGVILLRAQRYPIDQWQQALRLVDWAAALPAGTPSVGELAPPLKPTEPESAATSSAPASTPIAAARGAAPAHGGSGLPWVPVVVAAAIVVLAGTAGTWTWRRRRAH
ncbi:MAG TPA: serine hydrolase [Jatrophihabitans sp.]|nr:serine hydrolase [Jatrophihabitans sp.]